jgi:hypothetical protein
MFKYINPKKKEKEMSDIIYLIVERAGVEGYIDHS